MNWKHRLLIIRDKWYQSNYSAARDFGTPLPKPYTDKTSNGLTRCIVDFLKYSGHYANRINSTGMARIEKIEMLGGYLKERIHWTPGLSNKGTADITAIINGKHISIEVKCETTHDRMSKEQIREKQRIEDAGGVYVVAKNMEQFLNWYDDFLN